MFPTECKINNSTLTWIWKENEGRTDYSFSQGMICDFSLEMRGCKELELSN